MGDNDLWNELGYSSPEAYQRDRAEIDQKDREVRLAIERQIQHERIHGRNCPRCYGLGYDAPIHGDFDRSCVACNGTGRIRV